MVDATQFEPLYIHIINMFLPSNRRFQHFRGWKAFCD